MTRDFVLVYLMLILNMQYLLHASCLFSNSMEKNLFKVQNRTSGEWHIAFFDVFLLNFKQDGCPLKNSRKQLIETRKQLL